MRAGSFERFAGACAVLAAGGAFFYSVAFVIVSRNEPELGGAIAALFLTLGGILTSAVLVAVYGRLREVDPGFALWATLLGMGGAVGSTVHGGYQLANTFHPPAAVPAGLPSEIDPRGLLTFGLAGLAVLVVGWLIVSGGARFPVRLGYLGLLFGVLLVLTYLGRLIVLDPGSLLILAPAGLAGFIVGPLWYLWLGLAFLRGSSPQAPAKSR